MDGLEVIKIIAADAPDTPLIMVSGAGLLEDATEALRMGAWDYITKPIADMVEVEHVVNKALEKAALLAENRHYQIRLQRLLQERTQEFNKSQNLLETIFTGMPGVMFIYELTPAGTFELVRWNPVAEKVFGYSDEELAGSTIFMLIHEKHHASIKQRIGLIFKGEPEGGSVEYLLRCKNGEEIPFLITTYSTSCEGKTFIVGFGIDITEQLKLEEHLRQAQKMESIATLAGGIAHDFNNILAAIISSNEFAMMKIGDNPQVMKSLKRIDAASFRARDLVQQILTFGRPARDGKISMQPASEVKEALKLLRASIPTTIDIRSEISGRGTIKGDPTQIHQIVMNLCTNAFHAMREGGGVLGVLLNDVTISENDRDSGLNIASGNYLLLEVSDTGHGMSKEILEKIFEPYFTTKSIGDGTGLGLAVTHGIIESHNGLINVYSEPGAGTVFRVYFPVVEEIIAGVKGESQFGLLRGDGEHLMVVDDEERLLEALVEYLREAGYRVSSYSNGLTAWEAFQKQPAAYDLLLTDMAMPGFDGKVLSEKVLHRHPQLPVIINTGFSSLLNREDALALGVADYLQKPVSIDIMLTTIKRVLDEKSSPNPA